MKKTQRQFWYSVSQPPSVGPRIGPSITPTPQTAIAAVCFSRGQVSSSTACASGTRNAPKAPCSTRNSTSWPSVPAAPHSIEATVKPITDARNRRRRPKRSARKPVSGMQIAVDTM